jgi:hypothetical protein
MLEERRKKCKMSPMLELVLQASSRLWNLLVTEGSITELNSLSHTHRDSPKCREYENKMQNELSVATSASSIQPTLVPPRYRGSQHWAQSIELNPLSHMHRNSPKILEERRKKYKMSPLLKLVLQASSQLWYHLVTEDPNIELNALWHMHRNSPEMLEERRKKCKMSPVLELVLQASSQFCYHLVIEGPNIELNPLSHTHRYLPERWGNEKRIQNEPSVGAPASSIQSTLEPLHYRGLQHWV